MPMQRMLLTGAQKDYCTLCSMPHNHLHMRCISKIHTKEHSDVDTGASDVQRGAKSQMHHHQLYCDDS